MQRPEKNSYKEFDNEKKFLRPENVMPTSKHRYKCFLILVQSFSACTFSRIYALIVSDTNFYQFGHTFSF